MATYTTNGISVKFEDNSPLVLEALKLAKLRGLEACGAVAESYAKENLERPKAHKDGSVRPNVVTGRLVNSVTHAVENEELQIGSEVEYALDVELGTPHTWAYPYLKPAIVDHENEYNKLLENSLKNA